MVGGGVCLFRQLLSLDDHLDVIFLAPALIVVAPPHWSLVLASKAKVFACGTAWRTLITLLSSKSACIAAFSHELVDDNREATVTRRVTIERTCSRSSVHLHLAFGSGIGVCLGSGLLFWLRDRHCDV